MRKSAEQDCGEEPDRESLQIKTVGRTFMEKEFKEGAEKVIRACGEIIRNADRSELGIVSKEGHANFVTRYDALVQKELQQGLQKLRPGRKSSSLIRSTARRILW